jgi:hypothetical protein
VKLDTFTPHLATFCPGVPSCPHEAAHAGSHRDVARPSTARCAPGRCYCPPPPEPDPPPRDLDAVDAALAEARARLAAATAHWRELDDRRRP